MKKRAQKYVALVLYKAHKREIEIVQFTKCNLKYLEIITISLCI